MQKFDTFKKLFLVMSLKFEQTIVSNQDTETSRPASFQNTRHDVFGFLITYNFYSHLKNITRNIVFQHITFLHVFLLPQLMATN